MQRFIIEESKKQNNIEEITAKALPLVDDSAHPENMETDWISNFYDKCRLISDDEMQNLWSKVLAGEAKTPGSFSKRTVNILSSLDKSDALLFQSLCDYGWNFNKVTPIIFDNSNEIITKNNITFASITHLDSIGLLRFAGITNYFNIYKSNLAFISYFGQYVTIEFIPDKEKKINIGQILLTKTGEELAHICGSSPVQGFFDYVIDKWTNDKAFNITLQPANTIKKTRAKKPKS